MAVTLARGPHRFARQHWLALGMRALGEQGPAGLTIAELCARASKTRGSFYAHFASTGDFIAALSEHWRAEFTDALINAANKRAKPGERLDHLNQLAVRLDARIERGMRRLAAVNESVAKVCAEVDARRMDYLAALYQASGRFSAHDAKALARIEYAAYVGFQQIAADAPPAAMRDLYASFLRLTGRV